MSARFHRPPCIAALYGLAAALVFLVWVWGADSEQTSFTGDPRSTLSDLIYGRAHKPFVLRPLVPMMTQTIHASLPHSWRNSVEQTLLASGKMRKEMLRLGWEEEYLADYCIALGVAFASLLLFPFIIRSLWKHLYATTPEVTNIVPLVALAVLPVFFNVGTHYIYDFPTLTLFSAGLLFLLRKQWPLFYTAFALGCVNKETAIFLTLAMVLVHWGHEKRGVLAAHAVLQIAIAAAIRLPIMAAFAANPGSTIEFHLFRNIHDLLMGYGFWTLLGVLLVFWLVFNNLSAKPDVLRRLAWLMVPFGGLLMISGLIAEVRSLYEIYPVVLFLALHTVFFTLMKVPYAVHSQTASAVQT